jgi:membrane protease YdiL (CAAX protease family)
VTGPLLVAGVALQTIAWRIVALRRAPFWPVVGGVWALLGGAVLLVGGPAWSGGGAWFGSSLVGAGSGLVLYAATRIVVTVASRLSVLADAVEATYERSTGTDPWIVWLLTLLVAVPGEELFWRGLVTPWLVDATTPSLGGVLAWLAGIGVAAAWSSLPFFAAATVGGALWVALAIWTGGILAPLASHAVWTACMIAWRPPIARAKVAS